MDGGTIVAGWIDPVDVCIIKEHPESRGRTSQSSRPVCGLIVTPIMICISPVPTCRKEDIKEMVKIGLQLTDTYCRDTDATAAAVVPVDTTRIKVYVPTTSR